MPSTAAITSGKSVFDRGFEYYTFQIGMAGFNNLSRTMHDPLAILAGWYLTHPRPSSSEIIGLTDITPNPGENLVRLTVKIQRGHYFLAEFLREHVGHHVQQWYLDDEYELYCDNCEENIIVYRASVPDSTMLKRASFSDTQVAM